MKKKIWALSLAAVMAATCLCGCGGSKKGDTVLTWYVPIDAPKDEVMVEERVNELLEGKLDAKLDLIFIDSAAYKQKMGMVVTSSEPFDLCFTASWSLEYADTAQKGGFLEVSDLLNEYGKGVKELIPEEAMNTAKIDGKLYAIPNYQCMTTEYSVVTYKSLADKYGFDMSKVKKIKDIEPFLEVIKQNEPTKIPYRLNYGPLLWTRDNDEGVAADFVINKWDDSYEVYQNTDAVIESAKTYIDWYEKGYIRADINTVQDESTDAKNGRYAFWCTSDLKPGWEQANDASYNGDGEYVAAPISERYMTYNAAQSAMTAISATSKNPELAMQLINIVNTDPEIYNTLCYGIEGVHYTKLEDGTIDKTEQTANYNPACDWVFGCQFNALVKKGQPLDIWDQMKAYNESAKVSKLAGFYFDKTPVLTEISNVNTVAREYDTLFNGSVKASEFDAKFKEFQERKASVGLDKIKEEVQKQIDEWHKK